MDKLRQNYLKVLIATLKDNVKKTSTVNLDDLVMTHFGMNVEAKCCEKNYGITHYTKEITAARINIERCTAQRQLFPMIAQSLHVNESETIAATEKRKTEKRNKMDTTTVNNNNGKIIDKYWFCNVKENKHFFFFSNFVCIFL